MSFDPITFDAGWSNQSSLQQWLFLPPLDTKHVPFLSLPELDFPPPSPSDSSDSFSDHSPSPPPLLHVVCNAPLVAPIPLPYHSPTFLQFDLLPDIDDDLSYPPYTHRRSPAKRKRADEQDGLHRLPDLAKRRVIHVPHSPSQCIPAPARLHYPNPNGAAHPRRHLRPRHPGHC